jgi:hypothetical protein
MTAGRNDPCPCGSGRKYKQCCLGRQQSAERVQHRFGVETVTTVGDSASGVWQVDLVPLAVRFDSDAAARPAVALVVEDGAVLDFDLQGSPPSELPTVAADLERVVARAAKRLGQWPRRVEVRDAEVARHLAGRLAAHAVEVVRRAQLEALDSLANDLREHLTGSPAGMPPTASPETWRGWGLPQDTIAEIFRAAADFWRRRPWRWIASDDPIFAIEGTSRPWTCAVLGNAGEQFGLALHAEADDFFRMFESESPLTDLTGAVVSLTFDRATELPPRMRREVAAAGWEVAGPDAYPVLITVNTPAGALPRAMAEDLTLLLRSVSVFVEQHREALDADLPPFEPLEWRSPETGVLLRLEAGPDADLVDLGGLWDPVEFLEPCMPEGPAAEPEVALEVLLDEAEGIDALSERELAVVDRFAAALGAEGLSDATVRKHATNVETFVQMLTFHLGVPLRAVTEYDLRSFLFDLYPRKVAAAKHRAEALPASLTRFFEFLAGREGIVCPWAFDVLAERAEYRERIESFPGGFWWDEGVGEWRAVIEADLINRALVHWPLHADGTPWGPTMGPVEAGLELEVRRRWLFWRDEAIRDGLTDPFEVRGAAIERQLRWEQMPHPKLGGRTPLEAIQQEREESGDEEPLGLPGLPG